MRIVCWQTVLMKYHTLFFRKFGKMLKNLSSAAVEIGALRVKSDAPLSQRKNLSADTVTGSSRVNMQCETNMSK